eukprot:jgi/Botrbrau1/21331/Bobra.0184s0041.1
MGPFRLVIGPYRLEAAQAATDARPSNKDEDRRDNLSAIVIDNYLRTPLEDSLKGLETRSSRAGLDIALSASNRPPTPLRSFNPPPTPVRSFNPPPTPLRSFNPPPTPLRSFNPPPPPLRPYNPRQTPLRPSSALTELNYLCDLHQLHFCKFHLSELPSLLHSPWHASLRFASMQTQCQKTKTHGTPSGGSSKLQKRTRARLSASLRASSRDSHETCVSIERSGTAALVCSTKEGTGSLAIPPGPLKGVGSFGSPSTTSEGRRDPLPSSRTSEGRGIRWYPLQDLKRA